MANIDWQERMAANPYVPKRGRGRGNLKGVESSHAAHSQVVHHTQEHMHDT